MRLYVLGNRLLDGEKDAIMEFRGSGDEDIEVDLLAHKVGSNKE